MNRLIDYVEVSECNTMPVLQHHTHCSGGSLNTKHINMDFGFRDRAELVNKKY
jgi:hypothetical protein